MSRSDHSAELRFVVTNTIIVREIQRSVAFYRDVLGATVLRSTGVHKTSRSRFGPSVTHALTARDVRATICLSKRRLSLLLRQHSWV